MFLCSRAVLPEWFIAHLRRLLPLLRMPWWCKITPRRRRQWKLFRRLRVLRTYTFGLRVSGSGAANGFGSVVIGGLVLIPGPFGSAEAGAGAAITAFGSAPIGAEESALLLVRLRTKVLPASCRQIILNPQPVTARPRQCRGRAVRCPPRNNIETPAHSPTAADEALPHFQK